MMQLRKLVTCLTMICASMSFFGSASLAKSPSPASTGAAAKPNFLIIVLDDLGYTDIGAFGGEISTPNLDKLVREGTRLSTFYTGSTCSPTRAMLMTSVDHHRVGLGNMAESMAPNQRGKPGYEGYLNDYAPTMAQVLIGEGYNTYISGKWHLGLTEDRSPAVKGFKRSFVLTQGGGSHFDDRGLSSLAPKAIYRENGKLATLPSDFYSTDLYTSKLIEHLEADKKSKQPFFAYLAYTAPHWPLQAPDDLIKKYETTYRVGYEKIKAARLKRAKALGVIPAEVNLHEEYRGRRLWTDLTEQERNLEARRMAVYAAMIESVDVNIGRMIAHLRENRLLENTYIFVLSDNGAEGFDISKAPGMAQWVATFDNSYRNIGRKGSYTWLGSDWAHVTSAPLRDRKGFTSEGGIRVPALVYHEGSSNGGVAQQVLHVKDIMPTVLELAGRQTFKERASPASAPMEGISFAGLIEGSVGGGASVNRDLGWEQFGRRALRRGNWKIVFTPAGDVSDDAGSDPNKSTWRLYDLASDPGETKNRSREYPELFRDMIASWNDYSRKNGVIIPDPVLNY